MSSNFLLLKLCGVMQSYGSSQKWYYRLTNQEPTKSAVVGMLCAALGRDRSEPVSDLSSLPMHVRVDKEGGLMRDLQTAGGGSFLGFGKNDKLPYRPITSEGKSKSGGNAIPYNKDYLCDAKFLVAIKCKNEAQAKELSESLKAPKNQISLGRKSCVPSEPIFYKIVESESPDEIFEKEPIDNKRRIEISEVRVVMESDGSSGRLVNDVPVNFKERTFSYRYVNDRFIAIKADGEPNETNI